MSAPLPVPHLPRAQMPAEYDQAILEQAFQAIEEELVSRFSRKGDLAMEPGKKLVLASQVTNKQYAIAISSADRLILIDYETGVASEFVLDMGSVDGLAVALADIETAYESADAANAASIAINASAISTNESAISSLETEITAARDGESSLLAKIGSVETAFASADAAIASDVSALGARVTTNEGDISSVTATASNLSARMTAVDGGSAASSTIDQLEAIFSANQLTGGTDITAALSAEASARASADSANATSIETLSASVLNPGLNLFPHPSGYGQGYPLSTSDLGWVVAGGQAGNGWNQITSANSKYGGDGYYEYWAADYSSGSNRGYQYYLTDAILAGQTYTLSFYGFTTNITGQFYVEARTSGGSYLGNSPAQSMPTSGERSSVTYTLPASTGQLRIIFRVPAQSVTGPSEFFVKQIKLEIGSEATSFSESNATGRVLTAATQIMRQAFVDASTGEAFASFDAEAAAGGFSAMLRMYAGDGSSSIGLYAEQLYLGDDTVFEDTYNSFYSTSASKRLRMMGPFGASSDLVMWYGPTSVSLNSETKTNGYFAMGTNGVIYIGSTAQGLYAAEVTNTTASTGTTSGNLSDFTITPKGGDGAYTYSSTIISNTKGIFTLNAASTSTPYLSYSGLTATGQYELCIVRCTVTETSTGLTATTDHVCNLLYIPPP